MPRYVYYVVVEMEDGVWVRLLRNSSFDTFAAAARWLVWRWDRMIEEEDIVTSELFERRLQHFDIRRTISFGHVIVI